MYIQIKRAKQFQAAHQTICPTRTLYFLKRTRAALLLSKFSLAFTTAQQPYLNIPIPRILPIPSKIEIFYYLI